MSGSSQHILYANESQSIIVIDIPASIAAAQTLDRTPSATTFDKYLKSCPPLLRPYQTPEPKVRLRENCLSSGREIKDDGDAEADELCNRAYGADKVKAGTAEDAVHEKYSNLIGEALVEVRERYGGPMCGGRSLGDGEYWHARELDRDYDRGCAGSLEKEGKELRLNGLVTGREDEKEEKKEMADDKVIGKSDDLGTLMARLCESECMAASSKPCLYSLGTATRREGRQEAQFLGMRDCGQDNACLTTWEGFAQNPSDDIRTLSIYDSNYDSQNVSSSNNGSSNSSPYSFYIPPRSTFHLNDCHDAASFHAVVRNLSHEDSSSNSNGNTYKPSRRFDLILLDPPWPNASAKRKRKHSRKQNRKRKHGQQTASEGYSTQANLRQTRNLLYAMDLDRLVAPNALVGIWITNKPAVRNLILGPGGLFERLNVFLVEEWVWVKVTTGAEPVTPLDGAWRKPYEVLLLGRASASWFEALSSSPSTLDVKYRVLIAVPDLHSRKPCLKALLEPMVCAHGLGGLGDLVTQSRFEPACRALEVFARHLVAGWWSWGDQVLLYQRKASWSASDAERKRKEGEDVV